MQQNQPTHHLITHLSEKRWREYKALRIEAINMVPQAFVTSPKEERAKKASDWKHELTSSTCRVICIERKGTLVGFVKACLSGTERTRHLGFIYSIFVLPEYRRQKFGYELMTEAIKFLRSHHVNTVELHVEINQADAIKLYKKFSFFATGIRRNATRIDSKDPKDGRKIKSTYYDFNVMSTDIR